MGGLDFEGGHLERKGLTPTGQVVQVPVHRHEVSLDYMRWELTAEYSFLDDWDVWLRVPYEVKRQTAGIRILGSPSASDVLAMERNRELHHPSTTLHGLSDLHFLLAHRAHGVLVQGDTLGIAVGTTLPTGQTERDPFEAGSRGQEHLHIQFGTGTLDPLLELYYRAPLPLEDLGLQVSAQGRFPFYENPKTYRGPVELTSTVGLSARLSAWISVSADFTTFWQAFAYWDGHRDENSGLLSFLGSLGVTVQPADGLTLFVGARYPLYQRTLSKEGDTFEQGPLLTFSLSWQFPTRGQDRVAGS